MKTPFALEFADSIRIWNIVCDRLLLAFIEVCRINRFFSPLRISYKQSVYSSILNSPKPSTKIPSNLDSWMFNGFGIGESFLINENLPVINHIPFRCISEGKSKRYYKIMDTLINIKINNELIEELAQHSCHHL